MMILSTSSPVSARLSPADRSCHASDGSGTSGSRLAGRAGCAHELADHVPRRCPPSPLETSWRRPLLGASSRSASFFCSCRWRISSVTSLIRIILSSSDRAILMASGFPPPVDHVTLHIRLQRLRHDAHPCWADGALILAAAVTASLPPGDRRVILPPHDAQQTKPTNGCTRGLPKFSRRLLGSSRSPTNQSWVARSMIAGHAASPTTPPLCSRKPAILRRR
jgi:hypothetical protein